MIFIEWWCIFMLPRIIELLEGFGFKAQADWGNSGSGVFIYIPSYLTESPYFCDVIGLLTK